MADTIKIFAFANHRYEDRSNGQIYEIQPGTTREFPEEVALYILENHPNKLTRIDSDSDLDDCMEEYHSIHKSDVKEPRTVDSDSPRLSGQKRKLRNRAMARSRSLRVSIRDG